MFNQGRLILNTLGSINCSSIQCSTNRNSRPKVFCKKGALKYFAKIIEKHQYQSLFYDKIADRGLHLSICIASFTMHCFLICEVVISLHLNIDSESNTSCCSEQCSSLETLIWTCVNYAKIRAFSDPIFPCK